MGLTRKEFLQSGLYSLGEAILGPVWGERDENGAVPVLHPPGFRPERSEACRGCNACIRACPGELLRKRGDLAAPVLSTDFGGCSFCMLCVGACPGGVLAFPDGDARARIGVARTTGEECLGRTGGCFSCLENCPQEAIRLVLGQGVLIDTDRCTGCGWCEFICPVSPRALRVEPLQSASPEPARE